MEISAQEIQNPNIANPVIAVNTTPANTGVSPNTNDHKNKHIRLLVLVLLLFMATIISSLVIMASSSPQEKKSAPPSIVSTPTQSTVTLKSEYKNPFDSNTQYANPFAQYKNPFDSIK